MKCFRNGFEKISKGGLYIVEDIHTSMISHDLYISENIKSKSIFKRFLCYLHLKKNHITLLSILLAFDHFKRMKLTKLNDEILKKLSNKEINIKQLKEIFSNIEKIDIYKRNTLPMYCFNCKKADYDYKNYLCACGEELFKHCDSVTISIKKINHAYM